jgi:hypothetical protein
MLVTCRFIACAALCFVGAMSTGSAQNTTPVDRSTGLPAATAPNENASGILPPTTSGPKKPGARQARPPYASSPLSYGSSPLNYPSSEARLRTQQLDPNKAAAMRQSGLNQGGATSLITTQGYTRVGEVQADPNSIWVWQADAMKNGRPVRLGINNRGTLVEISGGQTQPCATPGAGFGAGPMGVGSRLAEAANCSAR